MSWSRVGVLGRLSKEVTGVLARTLIKRGIWEGSRAPSLPVGEARTLWGWRCGRVCEQEQEGAPRVLSGNSLKKFGTKERRKTG